MMGYSEVEIFAGKDKADNDIYAGFRFVVNVAQGTTLTMAKLHLYLERMYPASTDQDVLDHFTDSNGTDLEAHTMDVGPATGWVADGGGTIEIDSNHALATVNPPRYVVDVGIGDGTLMCEGRMEGSLAAVGLMFRFSDSDNYWRFYLHNPDDILYLYKIVSGVETQVNTDSMSLDGTTWYNIRIVLSGTNIKCYVDDVLKFDETSSDLQANTKVGLWGSIDAGPTRPRWDNFEFIPSGTPDPLLWAQCDDVDDSEPFCEKMDFDSGSVEFTVTETLTGDSSGATGVVNAYSVTSGTWGGGDAAGTVYLTSVSGTFTDNEALNGSTGGNDMATADGTNSENLPDSRVLTTNTISLGDISGWSEGAWNITTDIKSPIQEVLNRGSFVSGNNVSVILLPQVTEDAGSKIRLTSNEGGQDAKLYLYY